MAASLRRRHARAHDIPGEPFSSQLETVTDYAGYLFVVVGVSIGLSRQFGTPVWLEPGRLTAAMAYGIVL